jgi:Icc protein
VLAIKGWDLILLNSAVEGEIAGTFSDDVLSALDTMLQKAKQRAGIFLHHHPIKLGSPLMDQYWLNNADSFWNVVTQYAHKVAWVACGHVHQEFSTQKDKEILFFTTPSTSMQFKPRMTKLEFDDLPPGIRVWDLNVDGTFTTEVCRLSEHD